MVTFLSMAVFKDDIRYWRRNIPSICIIVIINQQNINNVPHSLNYEREQLTQPLFGYGNTETQVKHIIQLKQ